MCGIACYLGSDQQEATKFAERTVPLMRHRGPDDNGVYMDSDIALVHLRLSILELSPLGHQPMASSCGRYRIVFNGEIYNHLELRDRFLKSHAFKGHSDTETIVELFRLQREKMLEHMVGMWAIAIYDLQTHQLFISRDRYGQKPVYTRFCNGAWVISSEMKALMSEKELMECNATAVVEYIALGNYGHLGIHSFFKEILHFPQGHYAWLSKGDKAIKPVPYWKLPDVPLKDRMPFNDSAKKQLKDAVIEAVSSQTLSDVPIGITLSGGIDSSIVTGILSRHYDKELHIFTAQTPDSKFDETRYVDAVIKKWNNPRLVMHRKNLTTLSLRDDLERYISIQEEPFGDPSIIAHGSLMQMAAEAGIKVILNGQGADEVFFGYNNMAQATLKYHLGAGDIGSFTENLKAMRLGRSFLMRSVLQSVMPGMDNKLRAKSRVARRANIKPELTGRVNEQIITLYSYGKLYDVWQESMFGSQLPHLVQYDDRNGMAYSVEGRSPFLDHRIADVVANIHPRYYLQHGLRKYILRETFKDYLPEEVYKRTDKIGFYTPLVDALIKDKEWVASRYQKIGFMNDGHRQTLLAALAAGNLSVGQALNMYRELSVQLWADLFNVAVS